MTVTFNAAGWKGTKPVEIMENRSTPRMSPLDDMRPVEISVNYDPEVFSDIVESVAVEEKYTLTFPDGSTIQFPGYISSMQKRSEPATKFQAWKERWFPGWLKHLFPVKWLDYIDVDIRPVGDCEYKEGKSARTK